MTTHIYVGPVAAGAANGTSWANRYGTLNAAEDRPITSRTKVHVGPGVYREMLTVDVSGGNVYNAGTVSVTKGSTTVTGAGTAFVAALAVDDFFQNTIYASGADGVTDGINPTLTSAAGNFQANMVGRVVQINTKAALYVTGWTNAQTITLSAVPTAGAGLSYSIMSGEGPYEIAAVTDNTHFELSEPWAGRTLTGLAYLTYGAIQYIGDVTGELTDGVGGIVRITGSDNDMTATRANCIVASSKNYRVFKGFSFDGSTAGLVNHTNACIYWTLSDCACQWSGTQGFILNGATHSNMTVKRCFFTGMTGVSQAIIFNAGLVCDNSGDVILDCIFIGVVSIYNYKVGGFTVRNCSFIGGQRGISIVSALTVGQCAMINNNFIFGTTYRAIEATALGEVLENYNSFSCNVLDRSNVGVGANSNIYPSLLNLPILNSGYKIPWNFGELSQWSQLRGIAGIDESAKDLYGVTRPTTSAKKSWGAIQYKNMIQDTVTVDAPSTTSLKFSDAGRHQMIIPINGAGNVTVTLAEYHEANYAGTLPQLILKQPGHADVVMTSVGGAGAWNAITAVIAAAANPNYIVAELVSNNTAVAGNYACYWDLDGAVVS